MQEGQRAQGISRQVAKCRPPLGPAAARHVRVAASADLSKRATRATQNLHRARVACTQNHAQFTRKPRGSRVHTTLRAREPRVARSARVARAPPPTAAYSQSLRTAATEAGHSKRPKKGHWHDRRADPFSMG